MIVVNRVLPSPTISRRPQPKVVRNPGGARGQSASQDLLFVLQNGIGPGEVIDAGSLAHAAVYNQVRLFTRSMCAVPQTVNILKNDVVVYAAVIPANTRSTVYTISALPFAVGDIPSVQLPTIPDGQMTDLKVTLGSNP